MIHNNICIFVIYILFMFISHNSMANLKKKWRFYVIIGKWISSKLEAKGQITFIHIYFSIS